MTALQDKLLPTLDFLLHDWLNVDTLLRRPRFAEHDRETLTDLLYATAAIAAEVFEPANRTIDDNEPRFENGAVVLPPESKAAWDTYVEFGFLTASHDTEVGGLQLPRVAKSAANSLLYSA